jgi:hypothetical protein
MYAGYAPRVQELPSTYPSAPGGTHKLLVQIEASTDSGSVAWKYVEFHWFSTSLQDRVELKGLLA